MARIARPAASLAIWHRGRSHRRPNRNEGPNRRHFASLDLKMHAKIAHRRPTSQDFHWSSSAFFPVVSHIKLSLIRVFVAPLAKTNFFASLAIWLCVKTKGVHMGTNY